MVIRQQRGNDQVAVCFQKTSLMLVSYLIARQQHQLIGKARRPMNEPLSSVCHFRSVPAGVAAVCPRHRQCILHRRELLGLISAQHLSKKFTAVVTVCTVLQDCCKGCSNKYRKWHFWGSCRPETP